MLRVLRFYRSQFRSYLRFSLILLFAAAIVLTPWTLRNYYAFHRLIFVRGSFGLQLAIANNDSALPAFEQNLYTAGFQNIHPSSSLTAAHAVEQSGESAYYDQQLRTAYRWIGSHPGRFLRLTAEHVGYFWFSPLEPQLKGIISSLLTWCIILTGIAGLFMMLQHHRWPALTIGVVWLTYPLVYYLLEFDSRYCYPIEWTFLFTASYAAITLLARVMPATLREQVST